MAVCTKDFALFQLCFEPLHRARGKRPSYLHCLAKWIDVIQFKSYWVCFIATHTTSTRQLVLVDKRSFLLQLLCVVLFCTLITVGSQLVLIMSPMPDVAGRTHSVYFPVGHFLTRLDIELPSTKHWRCKARKIVMISSFLDSGWRRAFSICLSLNCCSIVSSTIGAGIPKSWFLIGEIIVIYL